MPDVAGLAIEDESEGNNFKDGLEDKDHCDACINPEEAQLKRAIGVLNGTIYG
jgi:hypothetical protein